MTEIDQPCRSMMAFTIDNPTPLPAAPEVLDVSTLLKTLEDVSQMFGCDTGCVDADAVRPSAMTRYAVGAGLEGALARNPDRRTKATELLPMRR